MTDKIADMIEAAARRGAARALREITGESETACERVIWQGREFFIKDGKVQWLAVGDDGGIDSAKNSHAYNHGFQDGKKFAEDRAARLAMSFSIKAPEHDPIADMVKRRG